MRNVTWHMILAFFLLWTFTSCSRDADGIDVPPAREMTLNVGFQMSTQTAGDEYTDGYEEGEEYENYIDVANGKYRIYFFGDDDKFIAKFEPNGFLASEGSGYRRYNTVGRVPEELARYSSFKMVVLANWPQFNDAAMTTMDTAMATGTAATTIDDLCAAAWSQFDILDYTDKKTNPAAVALNPAEKRLMPFFGVREYSGVTFTPDQITILDKPVTLLRALAKVEVVLESDNYYNLAFSSLKVNRYNATGYCAPKNVYKHEDYDHDGNYDEDYTHAPNLVNGKNDDDEKELSFRRVRQWSEGEKTFEKWTAYLPEYQNIGAGNIYSSIKAKFNLQLSDDTPHTIYFAKYSDDKTDNSDDKRMNIERNNIYRFRVKCTGYNFRLLLNVSDWEGVYENVFEFGNGQVASPVSPWEDEITNDFEF